MILLLILALLLAWPTYGISLILWFALLFVRSQEKTHKINARCEKLVLFEPLFTNRQADFFEALEVPLKPAIGTISHNDAHQCGRHIMNYIAHNQSELQRFVDGLMRWPRDDGQMCHPVTVLNIERRFGGGGVAEASETDGGGERARPA